MAANENHVHRLPETSIGGHKPADVAGYQVKHAADFVINYLNSQSNDLYSLELFQIVNATQQVWHFTAEQSVTVLSIDIDWHTLILYIQYIDTLRAILSVVVMLNA